MTQQNDSWSGGLPQKKAKEPTKRFVWQQVPKAKSEYWRTLAKSILAEELLRRGIIPTHQTSTPDECTLDIGPHAKIVVDAKGDIYGMIVPDGREENGVTGPWFLKFIDQLDWYHATGNPKLSAWSSSCRDFDHPLTERMFLETFLTKARDAALCVFGSLNTEKPHKKRIHRRSHKRTSK